MVDAQIQLHLPMDAIKLFCQRWQISEFALYGSIVRDDFGPDSDVDVLVSFAPGANLTPNRAEMREELEAIFNRRVDLTYHRVIEHDPNYIIRKAILQSAKVIYAA